MARRPSMAQTLQSLIDQFTPFIRDAFLAAIQDISDRAILGDIIAALEAGDVAGAIQSLGLSEAAFRPLIAEIERAFETGGVTVGQGFPNRLDTPTGRAVFRFDVRTSRAEAFLRDYSAEKVREVTEEARAVVRQVVQRGMVDGVNPKKVALDLVGRMDLQTRQRVGGVIGLTRAQNRWVDNTRKELYRINQMIREGATVLDIKAEPYFSRDLRGMNYDRIIERAARDRKPMDAGTVEKLVTQYKSNALRYRGTSIGRTEAIAALNKAEHEAINQAVDQGMIKQSQVTRVWDSAGNDGKTRETHLMMEGQTVGLNEPFTFPGGGKAMFPGDRSLGAPAEETIQCRCIARTKIDWLAGAREVVTEEERQTILSLSDEELFGGR